jgi:hypothetical protein
VATVEDLLVLKLIANRPLDQRDAILLATDHTIDWPYVEQLGGDMGRLRAP